MIRPRRLPRVRPRALAALVAVLAVLAGGWLWLRSSSLVAVRRVSVTGIVGSDAGRIRSALSSSARSMTTLDVSVARLRSVLAPYPEVRDLRVSTQFPHGLRIRVIERVPLGTVSVGGLTIAVARGGLLLNAVPAGTPLPLITAQVLPGGSRLTDGTALQAVALLAAAPYPMLAKLSQVTLDPLHGLVAQVRDGPEIYFGDSTRLVDKWVAALEVLGAPGSAGAGYIDVTDPARPAAGVTGSEAAAASQAPISPQSSQAP